jgi:hypothetical protein
MQPPWSAVRFGGDATGRPAISALAAAGERGGRCRWRRLIAWQGLGQGPGLPCYLEGSLSLGATPCLGRTTASGCRPSQTRRLF